MISNDPEVIMSPLITVPISREELFRLRQLLVVFDGEPVAFDMSEDGLGITETFSGGVALGFDRQRGVGEALAYDRYAMHFLLEAKKHFQSTPVPLSPVGPTEDLSGIFILFGLATGEPESCRLFGPIAEGALGKLQHPQVQADLGLVLSPFTAMVPAYTGVPAEPRVLVVLENIEFVLSDAPPRSLKASIADIADPNYLVFGQALIRALAADTASLYTEAERAVTKTQVVAMRCRLAQGLLALGLS